MERLVDLGLVKSIGVSNFNSQQINRVLANCRIKPVNNQVSGFEHAIYATKILIIFLFLGSIDRGFAAKQSEKTN